MYNTLINASIKKGIKMEDIWHYPRTVLAEQLTRAIEYNVIHSFTLFAPRRLGKTYFLNYDLKPMLEGLGYNTIYFSFANQIGNSINSFKSILVSNVDKNVFTKLGIKEVSFSWCKINVESTTFDSLSILELLSLLAKQAEKKESQIVLLLDEIQELVYLDNSSGFIGELRTALDLNKNFIKVIFTGSSRDGLMKMFSDSKAPFFHFGTSLKLEPFGKEFSDYLADVSYSITNKILDKDKLFNIFSSVHFVTLSIREFITHCLMLNTNDLDAAYKSFEAEILEKYNYVSYWKSLIQAECVILLGISSGYNSFYSESFYSFSKDILKTPIKQGSVQNALTKLIRKGVIYESEGNYIIEDVFLERWIISRKDNLITATSHKTV